MNMILYNVLLRSACPLFFSYIVNSVKAEDFCLQKISMQLVLKR